MATATHNDTKQPADKQPATRRPAGIKTGVVISDKREKTRTVEVVFSARNSKYGKYIRHRSRMQVHDPTNTSGQGDIVEISNCRPISKTKSWRLVRVVKKAAGEAGHQDKAPDASADE